MELLPEDIQRRISGFLSNELEGKSSDYINSWLISLGNRENPCDIFPFYISKEIEKRLYSCSLFGYLSMHPMIIRDLCSKRIYIL